MFPFLADFFSLSNGEFLHWMLAVALTLLVLDVFVNTELMSWSALVIFAAWGTWEIGLPLQWSLLVFLCFLALGFAIYFTLWNRGVRPLFMACLTRRAPKEATEQEIGGSGTIVGEGENLCVRREDRLYPVAESCRAGLKPGDAVRITSMDGACARVEKC